MRRRWPDTFGKKVLLVDRRPHIGGNAYDHYDAHGILVHKYGPHIFHTNSAMCSTSFRSSRSGGPMSTGCWLTSTAQLVPIPINLDTVNMLYGLNLTVDELEAYLRSPSPRSALPIRTSEDVVVSRVGRDLYEKLFRGYTRKQWGLDPSELDASSPPGFPSAPTATTAISPIRFRRCRCMAYTRMFENMLDHPNITIVLGRRLSGCDQVGALPRVGLLPARLTSFSIIASASCPTVHSSSGTRR